MEKIWLSPDQKSGTPIYDYTKRCSIDGKNHTTVPDLNCINVVNLFYSFIFQQSLVLICQLFPNYTVNHQSPYFMHILHEIQSFFWSGYFTGN